MSDSVQPHRRQPTRLPHPWDSPGKNTGVGCHFLLQCMKVKCKVKSLSRVRLLATPWTAAYQAPLSMGFTRQEYWSGLPLPSPSIIIRVLLLMTPSWNTLISHFSSEDFCAYRYIVTTQIFASSLSPSCFVYFPSISVPLCPFLPLFSFSTSSYLFYLSLSLLSSTFCFPSISSLFPCHLLT